MCVCMCVLFFKSINNNNYYLLSLCNLLYCTILNDVLVHRLLSLSPRLYTHMFAAIKRLTVGRCLNAANVE